MARNKPRRLHKIRALREWIASLQDMEPSEQVTFRLSVARAELSYWTNWARVEHVSIRKVSEQSEHLDSADLEQAPAISEA